MDPEAIREIMIWGGAAAVSKGTIEKIVGPSAEMYGTAIRDAQLYFSRQAAQNIAHMFKIAERHLGKSIDKPGAVHPKVLKTVFDNAMLASDDLGVEYFGGVLASSRTPVSRDDRGAMFARLTADLTTYQLRTHYLAYTAIKSVCDGLDLSISDFGDRRYIRAFIPAEAYSGAMDFRGEENLDGVLHHAVFGLVHRGLIGEQYGYGPAEILKPELGLELELPGHGIVVSPSIIGSELFLWAHGMGHLSPTSLIDPNVVIDPLADIPPMEGVMRIEPPGS